MTKKVLFKYWALLMVAILPMVISSCKDDDAYDIENFYPIVEGDSFSFEDLIGRVVYDELVKSYVIIPISESRFCMGDDSWSAYRPTGSDKFSSYDGKYVKFSGTATLIGNIMITPGISYIYLYEGELTFIEEIIYDPF